MKNEKIFAGFIVLFFLLIFTKPLFAESSRSKYILPYPSDMPGSRLYKINLIWEKISKYWYFGDFGQFESSLKMADKYLVEAKTLFEYKQYLLGYESLQKSDSYFSNILPNLMGAKNNNKNIAQKRLVLKDALLKHIETLDRMEIDTPDIFNWQPEKTLPTTLEIKKAIEGAIAIRRNVL